MLSALFASRPSGGKKGGKSGARQKKSIVVSKMEGGGAALSRYEKTNQTLLETIEGRHARIDQHGLVCRRPHFLHLRSQFRFKLT